MNLWMLLLAVIIAYLIGNISPSIIMAKARGIDIKKEGSGNAGTTNALRVMGKKAGAITLVVDVLKGTAAVLLGYLLAGQDGAMWCVVAVFCGHVWPAFYKFKGGKGVATAFGALMGLNPLLGLSALGIVIVGVLVSKRMSVGSILGAACFPFLAFFLEPEFVRLGTVLAVIILIKHRANIVRLCKGQEPIMSIFEKRPKNEDRE
ncbi:MAG: glycerol-3-phosphate 1-O-acyltransferase PlsY [Bacillota bacterium]|nr:glycerol-3-phosphate 1-O-acyltransferase PlsY [Bacillota bacterium]